MNASLPSRCAIGEWRLNLSIVPGLRRGFSGYVANGDCLRGGNISILTQMNANNTQVNAIERWFPDKRLGKPFVVRPTGLFAARSIRSTPDSLAGTFIFILYQPTLTWPLRRRRRVMPTEVGIHVFFSINQRRGWWAFAHHDEEKPLPSSQCFRRSVLSAFICVHLRFNSLLARRT